MAIFTSCLASSDGVIAISSYFYGHVQQLFVCSEGNGLDDRVMAKDFQRAEGWQLLFSSGTEAISRLQ